MRKDPPLTVVESRTMEQPEPPGAAEGLRGVQSDERRQRVSEQERKNEEMKNELVQKNNELDLAQRELLQAEEKAQGLLQIIERNEVGEGLAKLLRKEYSRNRQLQNKVDSLSCELKIKALEAKELERRLLAEYAQHGWVYKYVGSLELRGRGADRV
jgi:exonuclease VII large subunit